MNRHDEEKATSNIISKAQLKKITREDVIEAIRRWDDDDIVQDEDADIDDELVPTDEEIANPPVDDKKGRLKKGLLF